jgi:hypothetical protein
MKRTGFDSRFGLSNGIQNGYNLSGSRPRRLRLDKMDQRILSASEWGDSVKSVLTNKLVRYLFELGEEELSTPGVVAILEEELRPFLALKAKVQSERPEETVLGSAHEKLLELMKRSFMVTQQALLNRAQDEEEEKVSGNKPGEQLPPGADSGGKRLLGWHVSRMNDIGEQFLMALADLAEKHKDIYDQLDLPIGIMAESSSESADDANDNVEKGSKPPKTGVRRGESRNSKGFPSGPH